VIYAKPFFDLQLQFANKVTDLSGLPLAGVLLEYTNLYIRFGLGRDFDPAHPTWQEYLAGLQDTDDIREWTYAFYLTRSDAVAGSFWTGRGRSGRPSRATSWRVSSASRAWTT